MSKQKETSEPLNNSREISGALKMPEIGKLDFTLAEIVDIYNQVPRVLARKASKISPKNPQYLQASQQEIYFTEERNSNYWLITTEDNYPYLFPKNNLIINNFNAKIIRLLFDCGDYQKLENKEFSLIQPAKLSLMPNKKEWKLEEKGKLNFDLDYSEIEIRLKQAQDQNKKLQAKLKKIEKELQSKTSQVASLATEKLANIDSFYVSREEFFKFKNETVAFLDEDYHKLNQLEYLLSPQKKGTSKKLEETKEKGVFLESHSKDEEIKLQIDFGFILVHQYNNDSNSLLKKLIEVSETKQSMSDRNKGGYHPISLEETQRGVYGITTIEHNHYLVPSMHFRITDGNYITVEAFFECRNYKRGYSEKFTLIKPAKVSAPNSNRQWTLQNRGILDFSKDK